MTRDQVVDLILQRLVRRAGDADLVAAIIAELDLAQQTVCERGLIKPWFMLNIVETTVDATGWRAPLPENFIDLYEEPPALLRVDTTTGKAGPLERIGRSDLEWSLSPVNTVSNFEIMEGYILLGKQLTAGDRLRMLYYQAEPLPVGAYGDAVQSGPNRWYVYAPDVMAGEAGSIIAGTKLRDEKIMARLEALKNQGWNRLNAETIAKAESSKERFMSGGLFPVVGALREATSTGNVSDPVGFTTRTYNTSFVKGDTWSRTVTYSIDGALVDLTTYTAILTVRASYGSVALITLTSSPAAGIVLGGALGTIAMTISAAQSDTLAAGNYVYDLELTAGSLVATILTGVMTVHPEVT